MIYVVYATETGQALSIASTEPPRQPDGVAVYADEREWSALATLEWNPSARHLEPRKPVELRTLTKRQYRGRYTLQEKIALKLAATTHPDAQVRASLQVLEDELRDTSVVELDDPDTQFGAHATVDVLVGAGLVRAEERAARIAALLAPRTAIEMRAGAGLTEIDP